MGFLRIIAIIVIIYYLFKILVRIFMPLLAKEVIKKAERKFGNQSYNQQNSYYKPKNGKEGETVIDQMPQPSKKSNKKIGEYIDFEEIE